MIKIFLFALGLLSVRCISRFLIVRSRRKLTSKELACSFGCDEVGMHALYLISEMYSIDQGYIRPDDSFCGDSLLVKYDSWSFNYGYNELEDYVARNGGKLNCKWNVADFVKWYESNVGHKQSFCMSPDGPPRCEL